MENNLEKKNGPLSAKTDVNNFYNKEKGIQVAHADSFTPTINYYFTGAGTAAKSESVNTEYYNLIVGYDPFDKDHFLIDRSRALTEGMADEVKAKFCGWSEDQIAEIKKLPAIITDERNRNAVSEQQGVLAFIKSIRFQQNGIMVYFQRYFPVPMQVLQDRNFDLGMYSEWELNRTHWAIKNIDLMEVLQDAGVAMFPAE